MNLLEKLTNLLFIWNGLIGAFIGGIVGAVFFAITSTFYGLWKYLLQPLFGAVRTDSSLIKDTFINRAKAFPRRLLNVLLNIHKVIGSILLSPMVGGIMGALVGLCTIGSSCSNNLLFSLGKLPIDINTLKDLIFNQMPSEVERLTRLEKTNLIFSDDRIKPPEPRTTPIINTEAIMRELGLQGNTKQSKTLQELSSAIVDLNLRNGERERNQFTATLKKVIRLDPNSNQALATLNKHFGYKKNFFAFWKDEVDVFMDGLTEDPLNPLKSDLFSKLGAWPTHLR